MSEFGMKDSGARQEFETGARRDLQTGKGRPDLIPTLFIQRLAVVMEKGAEKYGDWNWSKGMPLSRYYASAMRHLMQAFDGDQDEDHLGQCAFNVSAFMWTLNEVNCGRLPAELDDRQFDPSYYGAPGHAVILDKLGSWELMPGDKNRTEPDDTRPEAPRISTAEDGRITVEDDTYAVTPAGAQLLEGIDKVPEVVDTDRVLEVLQAASISGEAMREAGYVMCFDGEWRPRVMPTGTPVETPIFARPAYTDPPLTPEGNSPDHPVYGETGELT